MKRFTFFILLALIFLSSFSTSRPELAIGEWRGVDFGGCANYSSQDKFVLTLSSDHTYSLVKKNYQMSWHETGMFTIDTINKQPTLKFINARVRYNDSYNDSLVFERGSHGYPVVLLSNDSLIIRYNVCCYQDTCDWTSGIVEFVRAK